MIELTQLHQAISATIKAGMPQLATVAAYFPVTPATALPALLHGMSGMQPWLDPGDGRSCVLATFQARLLVASDNAEAQLLAASLATRLTVLLRKQFWGLGFVEGALNVRANAVAAASEPRPHAEWQVQWEQPLYLGEPNWPWPDEPPGTLLLGISPDTGAGHQADYQRPEDLA